MKLTQITNGSTKEKPLKLCVVLNGPPNSGKDTLANRLTNVHGFRKHQMKDALYAHTAKYFSIKESVLRALAGDRETKEKPLDILENMTPRGALIHVSQHVIKPKHGNDFFGKQAAQACVQSDSQQAVFSDGGFPEEIIPLLEVFENVVLFHLHKQGSSFSGDSRNYVIGFPHTHKLDLVEGKQGMAIRDIFQVLNRISRPPHEAGFKETVSQVAGW